MPCCLRQELRDLFMSILRSFKGRMPKKIFNESREGMRIEVSILVDFFLIWKVALGS